jgi:hypothetical protein
MLHCPIVGAGCWRIGETRGTFRGVTQKKPLPRPVWYKNTFFWIAAVLFVLAVVGLPFLGGDRAIRDPGQKREGMLWLLYFAAAVIMVINGYISHKVPNWLQGTKVDFVCNNCPNRQTKNIAFMTLETEAKVAPRDDEEEDIDVEELPDDEEI